MTFTEEEIASIFNEWARRFDADPSAFDDYLSEEGKHRADYGESCAAYFLKIREELSTS